MTNEIFNNKKGRNFKSILITEEELLISERITKDLVDLKYSILNGEGRIFKLKFIDEIKINDHSTKLTFKYNVSGSEEKISINLIDSTISLKIATFLSKKLNLIKSEKKELKIQSILNSSIPLVLSFLILGFFITTDGDFSSSRGKNNIISTIFKAIYDTLGKTIYMILGLLISAIAIYYSIKLIKLRLNEPAIYLTFNKTKGNNV